MHIDIAQQTQQMWDEAAKRGAGQHRCMCRNVEIGSHRVSVLMRLPPHMSDLEEMRVANDLSPYITVDACLVEEIRDLWDAGIRTSGCCCGHNQVPGFIGVYGGDIPKMHALGYIPQWNALYPEREDGFYPKSTQV
jgi:hypothetical protein